jgi:hypothetical protein
MTSFPYPLAFFSNFVLRPILDDIWQASELGALGGAGGRRWIVTSQPTS